jgi:S1-C subfamily serine protease
VVPGSAADDAGLAVGDVILQVDGQRVNNVDEVHRIVSGHKSGDTVIFIVRTKTDDGFVTRRVRVEVP